MPAIVANELQDMQLRSAHVTDESLESTRRMIELCEGTKEAAIKALVELDDQGEKMDRIEEGMDQINADMKEAEKNLTGMEKCCGICVLPCNKSTSFKEDEGTWKGNEDGKVINKQPQRVIEGPNITPQGGYIVKITNDARETEMDENLGQVNTMIGNLRNMALDMGSELENQNQQIEKISTKSVLRSGQRPSVRTEDGCRPNMCRICGRTYARLSTLKTHLRTHSGEKPYRYDDCNKSSRPAANLTAHVRTPSGERPYRCRLCRTAFSDSSTLTKHLRIHSGEKPYQCKLCLLRFSQFGNLNRHMRVHHSGMNGADILLPVQRCRRTASTAAIKVITIATTPPSRLLLAKNRPLSFPENDTTADGQK